MTLKEHVDEKGHVIWYENEDYKTKEAVEEMHKQEVQKDNILFTAFVTLIAFILAIISISFLLYFVKPMLHYIYEIYRI